MGGLEAKIAIDCKLVSANAIEVYLIEQVKVMQLMCSKQIARFPVCCIEIKAAGCKHKYKCFKDLLLKWS